MTAPRLGEYWADTRPMRTITLEALMHEHALEWIDVLKLDCEGCELSILDQCQVLDRVGLIAGEFHGRERFHDLVAQRFADWKLDILRDGDPGTFWLTNPVSAERGTRNAEHDGAPPVSNSRSEIGDPQSLVPGPRNPSPVTSLLVHGRTVAFTAHHVLRFSAGPDGSLIPTLYFRGRELSQPWSLELACSGIRKNSESNGAVAELARDASAMSVAQNPNSAIRNRHPCRHLGTESGLRECKECRGNVHVKTYNCAHPAHVETTLAECCQCAEYEAAERASGDSIV
jgi:hypothetical protein